ncbi:MAG: hypothetical protein AAF591_01015 [Verrucomicrobiota bacterium]
MLKTDRDQQALMALEAVEILLAAGELEAAKEITEGMKGFRQPVALNLIAAELGEAGDIGGAKEFMDRAKAIPVAMREREMEPIFLARNRALATIGEIDRAEGELSEVKAPGWKQAAMVDLFDFYDVESLPDRVAKVLADEERLPGEMRGTIALGAAERLAGEGRREEALELVLAGLPLIAAAPTVETLPKLHRGVVLLSELGKPVEAQSWAGACESLANAISVNAYWKARDMALAADALRLSGKATAAEALLEAIPNTTAGLDMVNYSRGGTFAAEAYLTRGEEALFHESCAHVLRFCAQHPHHRARAMAALNVLMTYLRNDLDVPDSVRAELEAMAKSIVRDPYYAGTPRLKNS